MPNKTLERLYEEHRGKVSDRWSNYLSEYNRILAEYREKPVALLEIGVQNGGSLEIWSAFFPSATHLVGCDINPDCAQLVFDDPRIAVVIGDADSDEAQQAVMEHAPHLDVVIDDGSHRSSDIATTFARYFPLVEDGGVFIAEDMHCSYWREFEGGLFDPFSSIAFFKQLADVVNHEHWGVDAPPSKVLNPFFEKYGFQMADTQLQHVHSVEFVNSMCVVRKQMPERNQLGARFIAGSSASVVPGHWELHS
ncbi:MAG TPA: class I SAM-dependent methyltransferase, partial [Rhodothermia bacterium]|nr:class I SAM-dependent methyltransferase [Rhodothermia bacterium]